MLQLSEATFIVQLGLLQMILTFNKYMFSSSILSLFHIFVAYVKYE